MKILFSFSKLFVSPVCSASHISLLLREFPLLKAFLTTIIIYYSNSITEAKMQQSLDLVGKQL